MGSSDPHVAVRAELLVTFNLRHFEPAAAASGLQVLRPGDAIGYLEKGHEEEQFRASLQPSLMEEARKLANAEGVAVNQLINVAVAEKVSALRTEESFADGAARGDVSKALRILKRAGAGNAPMAGDELPKKAKASRKNSGAAVDSLYLFCTCTVAFERF